MILLDYNQICIAAIMALCENPQKLDEDLTRHMTLNTIRHYRARHKQEYGEMVVCCDNKKYWRKTVFPYYKIKRKINQEKSKYDWHLIFNALDTIRGELIEFFPYKVLNVEGAEADDIIGTLAPVAAVNEKVLIISSDKDFLQLQKYKNIAQFSPKLNRLMKTDSPAKVLKEHILRGDTGDGIPNFLSPDDVFAVGGRQSSIFQKKMDMWLDLKPEDFCDSNMLRRYERNRQLIDLSCIPDDVKIRIQEEYKKEKNPVGHKELTKYFMDKNLRELYGAINEFK